MENGKWTPEEKITLQINSLMITIKHHEETIKELKTKINYLKKLKENLTK